MTDAAGSSQSATLALAVPREPVPWGMLNIGSSFTPHDDPLRAAAKHLGWDAQGWRLDRGGTLGVGVGYTWNNDFTQRWRMLDAIRSGQCASLFLHQGTPWSNTQWGRVADERGELTDLGALHAFLNAAREVMPRHEWPVAFNAYWHWEIPGGRERDVKREYLTYGSEADATALYYEGALRQALEASRLAGQPVYLIPIGPVMHAVRRAVTEGRLPSLKSRWDLYSGDGVQSQDGGHLSDLGNTIFAQTYGVDPRQLPFEYRSGSRDFHLDFLKAGQPSRTGSIAEKDAAAIQTIIHQTLARDPFSGFKRPASTSAYQELMRQHLGDWESFDDPAGTWPPEKTARVRGGIELAPGGRLELKAERPFDVLYLETSTDHRAKDWKLETTLDGKPLDTLPAAVAEDAPGGVSRWFLRSSTQGTRLEIRNTGRLPVVVDNVKFRLESQLHWMLDGGR